jgi:hypothetical protein
LAWRPPSFEFTILVPIIARIRAKENGTFCSCAVRDAGDYLSSSFILRYFVPSNASATHMLQSFASDLCAFAQLPNNDGIFRAWSAADI